MTLGADQTQTKIEGRTGSANKFGSVEVSLYEILRCAEIYQYAVAFPLPQEHVFALEVAVDDAVAMTVLHSRKELVEVGAHQTGVAADHATLVPDPAPQVAVLAVEIHQEIQIAIICGVEFRRSSRGSARNREAPPTESSPCMAW